MKLWGWLIIGGGAWYLLSRTGALEGTGLALGDVIDSPYFNTEPLTPAQLAQLQANRQPAPGNGPVTQSASIIGPVIGIAGSVGTALVAGASLAVSLATAGIGLAVVFITYALLRQRASMHTNDVRDSWERQFVDLHRALGFTPLAAAQTKGSAPGTVEMGEVIFALDHDTSQRLWHAAQGTQNETAFRAAAANIDALLRAQGIPVQDVA